MLVEYTEAMMHRFQVSGTDSVTGNMRVGIVVIGRGGGEGRGCKKYGFVLFCFSWKFWLEIVMCMLTSQESHFVVMMMPVLAMLSSASPQ